MALLGYLFYSFKPIGRYIRPDSCTMYPWGSGVSRCKYKPDIFNHTLICSTVDEILASNCKNLSWDECMDTRAMELHQLNSKIYLMWSGGIDSTGVLVSILKNWPAQDLERVTVILSRECIEEAGGLYGKLIHPNFKILNSMLVNLEDLAQDGYIVTGEPADQLIGVPGAVRRIGAKYGTDVATGDWKKYAELYFALEGKSIPAGKIVETYAPLVEECPWKIKTFYEFMWWMNFSYKYQHVLLRSLGHGIWNNPKFFYSKLIHFFNTDEFNYWSINNIQQWLSTPNNKMLANDYIIKFTGIVSYARKTKEPSLQNTWSGTQINIAINDNWEFIDFKGLANDIVKV